MVPPPLIPFTFAFRSFRNDSTTRVIPFRRRMCGRTIIPSVYVGPTDYFIRNIRKFEEFFIMLHDIHKRWINLKGIVVTGQFVQPVRNTRRASRRRNTNEARQEVHEDDPAQRNAASSSRSSSSSSSLDFSRLPPNVNQGSGNAGGHFDFSGFPQSFQEAVRSAQRNASREDQAPRNEDQAQGNEPPVDQVEENQPPVDQAQPQGDRSQRNAASVDEAQPQGDQSQRNAPPVDQAQRQADHSQPNLPQGDHAQGNIPNQPNLPEVAVGQQEGFEYAQIRGTLPFLFLDGEPNEEYRHRYPGQIMICVIRAYVDGHIEDITNEMRERFTEERKRPFCPQPDSSDENPTPAKQARRGRTQQRRNR